MMQVKSSPMRLHQKLQTSSTRSVPSGISKQKQMPGPDFKSKLSKVLASGREEWMMDARSGLPVEARMIDVIITQRSRDLKRNWLRKIEIAAI
jgi:hypothetical protein